MESNFFFADETQVAIQQPISNMLLSMLPNCRTLFVALFFLLSSTPSQSSELLPTPLIEFYADSASFTLKDNADVERLFNRAEELSRLNDGWDRKDSYAINYGIIQRFKSAIVKCMDEDMHGFTLFPKSTGSLYLDYTSGEDIAGVLITSDKCIYFKGTMDKLEDKGSFSFTPENLFKFIYSLNVKAQA